MSVVLESLEDIGEQTVELWAPDFSVSYVWLVYENDARDESRIDLSIDRIDLSIDQLTQLRDAIDGILGRTA